MMMSRLWHRRLQINFHNNHSLLIFVTVLKEYVFDAFEVEAFDYLIKPLDSGYFKMDMVTISLRSKEAKSFVIQRGTVSQKLSRQS